MENKGKILNLANGEKYLVLKETVYENEKYYLMMNYNNVNDSKICKVINDDIEEIIDENVLKILINEFYETLKD